jgi:hypothetical protein
MKLSNKSKYKLALFTVLLILKITGTINLPWWLVAMPLWSSLVTIFVVGGTGVLIKVLIKRFKGGQDETL